MYLSLLQIKNFRCFDGNEHSITFKKGLNVLVGENDSGKSAIMDAIKLVLGTTDMNLIFAVLLLILGVLVAIQGVKKLFEKNDEKQTA